MPRKNKKSNNNNSNNPISLASIFGGEKVETKHGKDYSVRKTFEGSSIYKCPYCNNTINYGETSLTVIEKNHILGDQAAIDERRHWHESCWKRY